MSEPRRVRITPELSGEPITAPALEKAQKIADRVVLWTTDLESLLRQWKKQLNRRSEGHTRAETKFATRYYILGIPNSILGTIGSTGVVATFRNCDTSAADASSSTRVWCQIDQWLRLFMGGICLLSAVLAALMVFLNYGSKSEKHKNSGDNYTALAREIDTILRIRPIDRPDAVETIQSIRSRFDDLAKNSLPIPEEYAITLEYNFDPRGYTSELSRKKPSAKSSSFFRTLRKSSVGGNILTPPSVDVEMGMTGVSPSERGLAHILLDFDQDEDSDVEGVPTLTYDPERLGSAALGANHSSSSLPLEKSILGRKELQFELQRLAQGDEFPLPSDYPQDLETSYQIEYGEVVSPRATPLERSPETSSSDPTVPPLRINEIEAARKPNGGTQTRDTTRAFPVSGQISYYSVGGALRGPEFPGITVRRQGRSFPNLVPEISGREEPQSPKISPGRVGDGVPGRADEVHISDSREKDVADESGKKLPSQL